MSDHNLLWLVTPVLLAPEAIYLSINNSAANTSVNNMLQKLYNFDICVQVTILCHTNNAH